jgi:hypothetical protein
MTANRLNEAYAATLAALTTGISFAIVLLAMPASAVLNAAAIA